LCDFIKNLRYHQKKKGNCFSGKCPEEWVWHKFGDSGSAELWVGIRKPLLERVKVFKMLY